MFYYISLFLPSLINCVDVSNILNQLISRYTSNTDPDTEYLQSYLERYDLHEAPLHYLQGVLGEKALEVWGSV